MVVTLVSTSVDHVMVALFPPLWETTVIMRNKVIGQKMSKTVLSKFHVFQNAWQFLTFTHAFITGMTFLVTQDIIT